MAGTALVVVDVQESFRQLPLWPYRSNPDLVGRVDRLVDAARERGDLVVWVLHAEWGSGTVFDPAGGYVRLLDGLTPQAGEPQLTKTAHNAFTTTGLHQILTGHGVRDLVICGIRTEQCCETTARLGFDLGFRVTFVTDATMTFPLPHRDLPPTAGVAEILADPRTLTTEQVVTRTEYALAGRFATIASVDDLTGPVSGAARPDPVGAGVPAATVRG
ncbi:isochorismatase family protein [Micromonospora echinofusca]|uniref:Isochorismatase family protein n=1 Tax=Micromonospora echinofusca TaxID=47858 RepID=A0ABS3VS10_MICEH|nr:isochorismatase family protein [Micromonospora echinofusca]MBO4207290.1 isochorismatase family protein [Micromonospora echinofusca]